MSAHFVYTIWGADRRALYVGCTNNLPRRMREHNRSGLTIGAFWVSYVEYPDLQTASHAEGERIVKLLPARNTRLNRANRTVADVLADELAYQAYCDDCDALERWAA